MAKSKFLAIILAIILLVVTPLNAFATSTTNNNPDKITIGITYCNSLDRYIKSVEKAGAIPYVLPLVTTTNQARKELSQIDALIISGGSAVDPDRYDTAPSDKLEEVSPERDMSDMLMLKLAMELDMPVIGICRGMQTMNVVQGGTLYQDINDEYEGASDTVLHRHPEEKEWMTHQIKINKESLIYDIMNKTSLNVMSWHHQAVNKMGRDLTVTATAEDGIIEAFEFDNQTFMIGVQFHPERSVVANDGKQIEFFQALKEQGEKYRKKLLASISEEFLTTSYLCGHDNIKVCWDDVKNVSGYAVYYKKSTEKTYSLYDRVSGTSVKTKDLEDGVKYDFKIVPYIKRGTSYYETSVYATTSIYTLKKIEKPSLKKHSQTEALISWKDIEGQTGYQISRSTSSKGTNVVSTWKTVSGTSQVVEYGKTIGRPYYYKVRAYKIVAGEKIYGPWSDTVKYTREFNAPETAKAQLYGYDDIKISWSKVSSVSGYAVYYKKGASGKYSLLARTTKLAVKKSNLSDGVRYYFKVVPYYKSGSTYYNSVNFAERNVYTLKKVATPKVAKRPLNKVKVSWTDISGQTGYQISKSNSKTGTNIISTWNTTSGESKVVKNGTSKVQYYKVRAYKTVSGKKIYGPWSNSVKYVK